MKSESTTRGWRQLLFVSLGMVMVVGAIYFLSRPAPRELFRTASEHAESGELDAASQTTDKLARFPEYSHHVAFLRGLILLRGNHPMEALSPLRQAIDSKELRPLAYRHAGECYLRLERVAEAQQLFMESLAMDDGQVDVHRWLAAIYYDKGAMENAYRHLEKVALLDPADGRPHWLMGVIHFDLDYCPQAIEAFQESLRRNPTPVYHDELMASLAKAHMRQKHFDIAKTCWSKLPPTPQTRLALAECEFALGNIEKAQNSVSQVLEEQPDNLDAIFLAARIHYDKNEITQAHPKLARFLEQNPADAQGHYLMSQVLHRMGSKDEAVSHKERFQEISSLTEQFSNLHEKAIIHPSDPDIRVELSVLAEQLGKPKLAEVWLKAALACNPNHARALSMRNASSTEKIPHRD